MKKLTISVLCLLLLLSGCSQAQEYEQPINFYYCAAADSFDNNSMSILPETREGKQWSTLEDTMRAYLSGPVTETLASPFPAELRLVSIQQNESTVFVTFSMELAELTNLDLTIACGCITLTCLELTSAQQVTIEAENTLLDGQKSITMDRESLLLVDHAIQEE